MEFLANVRVSNKENIVVFYVPFYITIKNQMLLMNMETNSLKK